MHLHRIVVSAVMIVSKQETTRAILNYKKVAMVVFEKQIRNIINK